MTYDSGRQAGTEDEIGITPEMIEAGIDWFWGVAEGRFPITYDARSFVIDCYTNMELKRRETR